MKDIAIAVTVFCLALIPIWLWLQHIAREIDRERRRREMSRHIAQVRINVVGIPSVRNSNEQSVSPVVE